MEILNVSVIQVKPCIKNPTFFCQSGVRSSLILHDFKNYLRLGHINHGIILDSSVNRRMLAFFLYHSYDAGVEVHGTLQIPFLNIRARIDLSIAFKPFKLDANVVLDPIIYLGGLIKVVDADTDSKGAHLRMYITENLSDLMIDGSCRVS